MSSFRITEQILPKTRQQAYEFGINEGLLPRPPYCRTKVKGHTNPVDIFSHYYFSEMDLGMYRCSRSTQCRPVVTVAKGTWFEESRLSPEKEFR